MPPESGPRGDLEGAPTTPAAESGSLPGRSPLLLGTEFRSTPFVQPCRVVVFHLLASERSHAHGHTSVAARFLVVECRAPARRERDSFVMNVAPPRGAQHDPLVSQMPRIFVHHAGRRSSLSRGHGPITSTFRNYHAARRPEVRSFAGWLYNKRSSGKLHFLEVRDGTGIVQCVALRRATSAPSSSRAPTPRAGDSLEVTGQVTRTRTRAGGFELDASRPCSDRAAPRPSTRSRPRSTASTS